MGACGLLACGLSMMAAGCGSRVDVGSDVLWTALFEGGNLNEWTGVAGGAAQATPSPPNTISVSTAAAHHGSYGAQLTIDAGPDGIQENAGLVRKGGLPVAAYYSAWYYLPQTVSVGTFWLIFKLRQRAVADDPTTEGELYDVDLIDTPGGEMTVSLYDHRIAANVPLDVASPIVPISVWFQVEAFYRNADDDTGRLTLWLDGQQIVDVNGKAMAPTPWVEWDVVNVGENLTPNMVTVSVDDCAVSLSRVGPTGLLTN
jgi:hypothetical protein